MGLTVLQLELEHIQCENEGLRMHTCIAGLEADVIAKRTNKKSCKKAELPMMPSKAHWLTGEKGRVGAGREGK